MASSINFVFRPSTKAGRHPGSLSLRVIVNRKPKTVALSCYLYQDEWDAVRQTVIYPFDDPERAAYLQGIEETLTCSASKVNGVLREMERHGRFAVGEVVARYRLSTEEGKLLGYAAALSATLHQRKQKRLADAYGTVCRGLVKFNKGKDIPLTHINSVLAKDFETHLKESGKQPNTISYYMRNLRAIYNKAVEAGRIPKDEKPFAGVFTGVGETRKRALSADELNKIRNIDFEKLLDEHKPGTRKYRHLQNLSRARRLFFFCLYAQGMCFVDMCHLKKGNIHGDVIRYYRKKTGKQIEVPVNDGMRQIIGSFAQEMAVSEYLFPVLNDADMDNLRRRYETALRTQNRRLKKIATLAGLEKGISTHVARHSWASILKNEMQPLSVICEGLGHASEKMTRKYLDSFEHSVLGDAGRTLLMVVAPLSGGFRVNY